MTQSMTAFARSEADTPLGKLTMEVRSVNNRFLDVNLRLGEPVKLLEPLIREKIGELLYNEWLQARMQEHSVSM